MSGSPTVSRVAEALEVEPRKLVRFVEDHPDPCAEYVLRFAQADSEHELVVKRWLDERDDDPRPVDTERDTVPTDARKIRGRGL